MINLKTARTKVQNIVMKQKLTSSIAHVLEKLAARYGLPFGIFLAICVALLLTAISMTLYFVSGTAKLDLSRPGYEGARQQIRRDNGTDQNFSANGPLNSTVMKDFLNKYDKELKKLESYDKFDQNILEDAQIGLTNEPIAPTDGANP